VNIPIAKQKAAEMLCSRTRFFMSSQSIAPPDPPPLFFLVPKTSFSLFLWECHRQLLSSDVPLKVWIADQRGLMFICPKFMPLRCPGELLPQKIPLTILVYVISTFISILCFFCFFFFLSSFFSFLFRDRFLPFTLPNDQSCSVRASIAEAHHLAVFSRISTTFTSSSTKDDFFVKVDRVPVTKLRSAAPRRAWPC